MSRKRKTKKQALADKVAKIIEGTGDYFWSVEVLMELTGCQDRQKLIEACKLLVQAGKVNAITKEG